MSSLWKVKSRNATDGHWEVFVKCESPFEAVRLAAEQKTWDVLDGISVKGVLDFIEPIEAPSERYLTQPDDGTPPPERKQK